MAERIKTLFWGLAALLVCLSAAFLTYRFSQRELDFSCSAQLEHYDTLTDVRFNLIAVFSFRPDGKAFTSLIGNARVGGKRYYIARNISSTYTHFARHTYRVSDSHTIISKTDTLPDEAFERYFFSSEAILITMVKGISNAMLIGSRAAPAFMCVVTP